MISIIGAGPSGCILAYELAKEGFDVDIFEEHKETGSPIQCTGLVTKELFDLVHLKKEFLVNKLDAVQVIAPNKSSVKIKVNEFLLDRHRFDNYLLKKAIDAGANIHFSHRFIEYNRQNKQAIFKSNNRIKKIKTNTLIGADGPLSQVAKSAGIYDNRKFFIGMQATVKADFEKQVYRAFFGNIAPGFFAWIVPESHKTARIGLATRQNTRQYFQKFLKGKGKIMEKQAGVIPLYNKTQIVQKKNIYLLGDAATFCKATTGGGLVAGLKSAKILADCIKNKRNYAFALKKLRRQLWLHAIIRSTLDRFSTEDYNTLIKLINKPRIKMYLSSNSRENPKSLIIKLLLAEPRLLYFTKCLLQKKKVF